MTSPVQTKVVSEYPAKISQALDSLKSSIISEEANLTASILDVGNNVKLPTSKIVGASSRP